MKTEHDDRKEVTKKIRDALIPEFENLKTTYEKGELTENDLDYALARDRKAALILKTIQMEIQSEIVQRKQLGIGKKD